MKSRIQIKLIFGFAAVALIASLISIFVLLLLKQISEQYIATSLIVAVSVSALSVIPGVVISIITSKRIKDTAKMTEALIGGNLDYNFNTDSKDELGLLAKTISNEVREILIQVKQSQEKSEKRFAYQRNASELLTKNLERLSEGMLYCDFILPEPDEITRPVYTPFVGIGRYLADSVEAIKAYISEIADALSEIANGNLDVEIKSEFKGEFETLKDSINKIAFSFNDVMSEINTAAEQVASGSRQVSGGTQGISQGAAEQASSIEVLSASVSQIAEQIRKNAEDAGSTAKLSMDAKDEAVHGNNKMKSMLKSMEEINESSSNISKIIKVIDDIAFQTNILALNAAVEAARAGAHGKGFAVVAEEVRNLAARSADAAKETTSLIEGSINKVETGTAIARETADALESIVEGAEKSVSLLSDIARASNEQANGIAQINMGIDQLSQVVQTNSATSEQSAAASEELSSQAELLKSLIRKFKLRDETIGLYKPREYHKHEPAAALAITSGKPRILLDENDFGKY